MKFSESYTRTYFDVSKGGTKCQGSIPTYFLLSFFFFFFFFYPNLPCTHQNEDTSYMMLFTWGTKIKADSANVPSVIKCSGNLQLFKASQAVKNSISKIKDANIFCKI